MSLLLAFYGDDFTGSTDVLEVLTLGGVPTVLFLEPPTAAQLDSFPQARAVGIAGVARSLTTEVMEHELPGPLAALRHLDARLSHYKVCSTFDSSPELGSIGRAIELAMEVFPTGTVPLLVGAPALKRYVVFGNLFATVQGRTFRLDRHPTMRQHPTTPMDEADLLLHLARQTSLPTGLVDVLTIAQGAAATLDRLAELSRSGRRVVLFDTLDDAHLATLGQVLDSLADTGGRFVVGSSGVEYALVRYLQRAGRLSRPPLPPGPGPADRVVVMSGSAAPATAAQIDDAERRGFEAVRVEVAPLLGDDAGIEHERLVEAATSALKAGRSVVLYSARGPEDPALLNAGRLAGPDRLTTGSRLASAQGRVLHDVLRATGVRRVCVTGGDTCGYTARALGIRALELSIPIAPGSPLCLAHADEPVVDGLEIALKAGQVGAPDYFTSVLNGRA